MSENESSFESIPLPSSEAPDQSPKERPPARRRRWIKSPRLRRYLILSSVALVGVGLITAVIAVSYLDRYRKVASELDLGKIAMIERGCVVKDRAGRALGRIFVQDRLFVTYDQLPQSLVDAIVATEDNRFFEHPGYDFQGMFRAAVVNLQRGSIKQGGSTITQQLARHGLGLSGRNFDRKFTEIFAAARIEEQYTKEEILEHYFNRIYFGEGLYGVGAAARAYFGKPVKDLTVQESASLCALIKRPEGLNPHTDPEAATRARNITLERMNELGFIEDEEIDALVNSPLDYIERSSQKDRPHYLLSQIRTEVNSILEKTRHNFDNLIVQTTVSLSAQYDAEELLDRQLTEVESTEGYPHKTKAEFGREKSGSKGTPDYLQGVAIVIENETGSIVASVGGRDFTQSQFNRAINAKRRPGTVFSPFTYAAAFDGGVIDPLSPVLDSALDNRTVMIGGTEGVLGEWGSESLKNEYEGEIPAFRALAMGKNGATVRVGNQVGLAKLGSRAKAAGIRSELRDFPATYLGESAMTPMELIRAYTIFPNRGRAAATPHVVTSITDAEGNAIYRRSPSEASSEVISPMAAAQVVASLAHRSGSRKAIFKTGNSYGFEDAWALGFDETHTYLVWMGFDESKEIYPNAFGETIALPVLRTLMSKFPSENPIQIPLGSLEKEVCWETGKLAGENCRHSVMIPMTLEQSAAVATCESHDGREGSIFSSSEVSPSQSKGEPVPISAPLVLGQNPFPRSE